MGQPKKMSRTYRRIPNPDPAKMVYFTADPSGTRKQRRLWERAVANLAKRNARKEVRDDMDLG